MSHGGRARLNEQAAFCSSQPTVIGEKNSPEIRPVLPAEAAALSKLMCEVYSVLPGFPSPTEQPAYYEMLGNIGDFARKPDTEVLVALNAAGELLGGVVYFGDMAEYGSGGTATREQNASGIRLLAVAPTARSKGVGKALTLACIERARQRHHKHVVLHTTEAMQIAWGMYQRLGFGRAMDLDFMQEELPVFGFRLRLDESGK